MATGVNAHLYEFLHKYASAVESPFYAVLLNGKWGVGKTHTIKRFISDYDKNGEHHLYISLNGMATSSDVDMAIFQSAYPALQWKSTNLAGQLARSALKYLRVESELKLGDVMNRPADKLYIFDDLERCKINVSEILGYINQIVEHDGSKVILIANEEEIYRKHPDYLREKEKIIGKTFEVLPEIESALEFFVAEQNAIVKQIIGRNIEIILSIYAKSDLNNLRILKQTIWDYGYLVEKIDKRYIDNDSAMNSLLQLIFVLSFELKAGRINSSDIIDRMNSLILARMDSKNYGQLPIYLAQSRYPDVNLSNPVIPDALLRDILVRSIVDHHELCQALDRSGYFVDRSKFPAWRILWNNLKQSDEELEQASIEMEREFKQLKFTEPSQILHVFGLRILLVDIGIIANTLDHVVQECKEYIDKLLTNNTLKPLPLGDRMDVDILSSEGLGYYSNNTGEFKELFLYLKEKRKLAQEKCFPFHAHKLLELVKDDAVAFADAISSLSDVEFSYRHIPIMHLIDYREFVKIIIGQEIRCQEIILEALRMRYDAGQLNGELDVERNWVESVRQELMDMSLAASGWRKWRLKKYVEWYLDPVK